MLKAVASTHQDALLLGVVHRAWCEGTGRESARLVRLSDSVGGVSSDDWTRGVLVRVCPWHPEPLPPPHTHHHHACKDAVRKEFCFHPQEFLQCDRF